MGYRRFKDKVCRKCSAWFTPLYQKNCTSCVSCQEKADFESKIKTKEKIKKDLENGIVGGKPANIHFYNQWKKRAHKRSISFNLSQDEFDLFWKKSCYYCDSEIKTAGLDRVDSSLGYSIDNIVSCCGTCNMMKLSMSQDKFYNQCRKIIEKLQERNKRPSLFYI